MVHAYLQVSFVRCIELIIPAACGSTEGASDGLACAPARSVYPYIRPLYIFLRQSDCLSLLSRHLSRVVSRFGPDFLTLLNPLIVNIFLSLSLALFPSLPLDAPKY